MTRSSRLGLTTWEHPKSLAPRARLDAAIDDARDVLLGLHGSGGYWSGTFDTNVNAANAHVPFLLSMGLPVEDAIRTRAIAYVRHQQRTEGSWSAHHGGPGDLSITALAYHGLKFMGVDPEEPCMKAARRFVVARGGLAATRGFARVIMAIFGAIPWRDCPVVPAELLLLPDRSPAGIHAYASWIRALLVPMVVVMHYRPAWSTPCCRDLDELWVEPPGERRVSDPLERAAVALSHGLDRLRWPVLRRRALREAESWLLEHQDDDGSWGGVIMHTLPSILALRCLGYSTEHSRVARGLAALRRLLVVDDQHARLSGATSAVWDTAWSVRALLATGMGSQDPTIRKSVEWLRSREIRTPGDVAVHRPHARPGAWCFELHNAHYPDTDDTALVSMALDAGAPSEPAAQAAVERSVEWLLAMQGTDGGWAAFDVDQDRGLLARLPLGVRSFPLVDEACADLTGHVLEALAAHRGRPAVARAIERGVAYLLRTQEPDGAWYGRWGVNYVYGTSAALSALGALGDARVLPAARRAAAWLIAHQNEDGGWGESCASYDDPGRRGEGASTPTQTAWALIGLVAAGWCRHPAARKGVDWLLARQRPGRPWEEHQQTGTAFPRMMYIAYELYPLYFPLLALASYRTAIGAVAATPCPAEDRHGHAPRL